MHMWHNLAVGRKNSKRITFSTDPSFFISGLTSAHNRNNGYIKEQVCSHNDKLYFVMHNVTTGNKLISHKGKKNIYNYKIILNIWNVSQEV